MGHILADEVLGSDFSSSDDVDLAKIVDVEVTCRTPVSKNLVENLPQFPVTK